MRHLDPDLMMAPGIQMDLNDRIGCAGIWMCGKGTVVEARMFRAWGAGLADTGRVGASVSDQIVFQICFRRDRDSADCGEVIFPKSGAGELTGEFPGGSRCFGKDEKAFHRLIQTMDHGKVRFFSLPLPAFRIWRGGGISQIIFQQADHVLGTDPAALGGNPGRFTADDEVRVFIYDKFADILIHSDTPYRCEIRCIAAKGGTLFRAVVLSAVFGTMYS